VPYKDPEKRRAYQAAWQRKRTGHKQKPPFDASREDREPRACWHRFHTTNPCRNVAAWVSVDTATRWCNKHAQGLAGLVPYKHLPDDDDDDTM